MKRITVSVIGGHKCSKKEAKLAYFVGKTIAETGAVLVCGGLGGIMEAASKGAKASRGLTIGLLPGTDKADANPFIDIPLPTSFGYARNAAVACSADVIIALPGSHGTNSEICYGLVYGRPVIDLGGWNIKGMIKVRGIGQLKKTLLAVLAKPSAALV